MADTTASKTGAPGNSPFVPHTQADANAKLLAPAPTLLAALVYLRDCIESGIEPGMGKVNDAIRQAESVA